MLRKIFLSILPLMFYTFGSKSQNIEKWVSSNEKLPVEKLYLQTDREFYFPGETVWLKSYMTDSHTGILTPGAENIVVQLTDKKGDVVLETNLLSINGQSPGHIFLPDTLPPGNYLLRAGTDYLVNFGEESFFHKPISVTRLPRTSRGIESRQRVTTTSRMVADVQFLPEGGKLLQGISNLVAFKATDASGFGADIKGSVRDESGTEVAAISTDYKGMGLFFFKPEPGKRYRASINGFPSFRFSFDSLVVAEGVKIQLVNQTSRELTVNIAANSQKFLNKSFYIVNMHRGNVVFYQPFQMQEINHLLRFSTDMLKGGINQLVLLDENLVPVSERLLFGDHYSLNEIKVEADSKIYPVRSEVNLSVYSDKDHPEISNLSVAVVHQSATSETGASQNILSWLLLGSELKGFIESPSDFFNDTGLNAQAKLRLLMLTNGWSSYFWNSVPVSGVDLSHQPTAGLEISGVATDVRTGQTLKSGEITLVVEKDGEMAFLTQPVENNGQFTFTGLLFNDTASIYIQAKKLRSRKRTTITLNDSKGLPVSATHKKRLEGTIEFPAELERLKYQQYLVTEKFDRKEALNRTTANRQEAPDISKDGHFRIYSKADQVIEVPEKEASYGNILDFLAGKAAGLDISGGQVIIRGTTNIDGNSTPLFLIDGVPVNIKGTQNMPEEIGENVDDDSWEGRNDEVEKIRSIPLGDIEKVEILKSPQNLALFGVEGSNGVIAIYTRKGKTDIPVNITKGVLSRKITGYSSYRKFYNPMYIPENNLTGIPDYRTTLFWEPQAILKGDHASFPFFTSDQTGKYHVVVEGISESGKICIGSAEFEVAGSGE
jgi:hypothetical protein